MGIFRTLWKGLKGVGKWAVKHPDTVKTFTEAGVSIYDARRQKKSASGKAGNDYTLSNLNERINLLQDQLTEEIATVRTDLRQEYTEQLTELSQQVADIRTAQNYQAQALKWVAISFGCLIVVLIGCAVYLLIR